MAVRQGLYCDFGDLVCHRVPSDIDAALVHAAEYMTWYPNFAFPFFLLSTTAPCVSDRTLPPTRGVGGDEFYGRHRLQGTGIEKKKEKHSYPTPALPAIQFAGIMVGGLQPE